MHASIESRASKMRVGGMSSVDVFCGPHGASGVGSEFMSSTFAVDEPRSERPIAPNMPPPFFIALAPRNNSPADGACVPGLGELANPR